MSTKSPECWANDNQARAVRIEISPEQSLLLPHNDFVFAELKREGLIRHIGVSNITPKQLAEARTIAQVACVQNFYNVAHRSDDAFIDDLGAQGIAYVPFFPLGGFTPLQSSALDEAAASLKATPMQVALAWLLQHSPNILLIPGTSSLQHLRENLQSAMLQIPSEVIADLDAIGTKPAVSPQYLGA